MAEAVIMPKQGQSVETCVITRWNKAVGEEVKLGDILFEYETDKASFEEEAKAEGTLLAVLAQEGDEVPCFNTVAVIGKAGEDISALTGASEEAAAQAPEAEVQAVQEGAEEMPEGAVAVMMPKQGQSVETCVITRWNKAVGDEVKPGDILFEYETDKASFEEEAKAEGTLIAILEEEGAEVPCFDTVAVIGKAGTDVSGFKKAAAETAVTKTAAASENETKAQEAPAATVNTTDRIKISPRARNAAENRGLDAAKATPTGPNGRIIERDIIELAKNPDTFAAEQKTEKAAAEMQPQAASPAAQAAFEDVKVTGVRKAIAKSMTKSLSEIPQLTHTMPFDATALLAYRKLVKENAEELGLANINLNHMIMYAVSRVLPKYKNLNAHWLGDTIRQFADVNLGFACDTPKGLLVPVIAGAQKLSLNEIALATKSLAKKALDGKLSPDEMTGGTFTTSNVGAYGVTSFTPVINPPQTGILGICAIEDKFRVVGGEIKPYKAMALSLTYDHRACDGAPASQFMRELCDLLENFGLALAK